MVEITKEQFEEVLGWAFNYTDGYSFNVIPKNNVRTYNDDKGVIAKVKCDNMDKPLKYKITKRVYNKVFNSEFMNNFRKSMTFCKQCQQIIPNKVEYCGVVCERSYRNENMK